MTRLSLLPLVVAMTAALSPISQADDNIEHLLVTANRTARSAEQNLNAVTVITRADIERLQLRSLPDLLRGLPGISIANSGGSGKLTNISLRGGESDHVLVLIDGVKIGSATAGTAPLQDIPLAQVERIEIVRGPRSSLYGSDAIGGVIQIFTRQGSAQGLRSQSDIWSGSFGTFGSSVDLTARSQKGWASLGVTGEQSDGFNSCRANYSGGCWDDEPDRDGNNYISGQLRGGYNFSDSAGIEFNALRTDSDTEFDGSFDNESENYNQLVSVAGHLNLTSNWLTSLQLANSKDHSETFNDGKFASLFETTRQQGNWQNEWAIGEHSRLTQGVDYLDDQIDSSTNFERTERDNLGLYGQYLLSLDVHELEFSGRSDDNEQYGRHNTGSLAWGINLGLGMQGYVSYGTAFKAPSFNELYYPDSGNPNLQPEQSASSELGLRGQGDFSWSANLFNTEVEEMIGYDSKLRMPVNINEARIRGLELTASRQFDALSLGLWATVLDTENRSASYWGNELPRRSPRSARVDGDYQWGIWSLGASWLLEDKRYDNQANTVRMAGYGLLDVRGSVELAQAWQLQLRIGNLFDKEYETVAWYNQPERNATLTLSYRP